MYKPITIGLSCRLLIEVYMYKYILEIFSKHCISYVYSRNQKKVYIWYCHGTVKVQCTVPAIRYGMVRCGTSIIRA